MTGDHPEVVPVPSRGTIPEDAYLGCGGWNSGLYRGEMHHQGGNAASDALTGRRDQSPQIECRCTPYDRERRGTAG